MDNSRSETGKDVYVFEYPPKDTYRKRLCGACLIDLQHDGYITAYEDGTCVRGSCEMCGKQKQIVGVYRYTLSARERKRRGLD